VIQDVAGTGLPSVTAKRIVGLIVTLKGPFATTSVDIVGVGDAGKVTLAV
jgi:hypothetical protein